MPQLCSQQWSGERAVAKGQVTQGQVTARTGDPRMGETGQETQDTWPRTGNPGQVNQERSPRTGDPVSASLQLSGAPRIGVRTGGPDTGDQRISEVQVTPNRRLKDG